MSRCGKNSNVTGTQAKPVLKYGFVPFPLLVSGGVVAAQHPPAMVVLPFRFAAAGESRTNQVASPVVGEGNGTLVEGNKTLVGYAADTDRV
jgi:hypothetical protein